MALPFAPSKRPFNKIPSESNGRGKWQKTASFGASQNQPKTSPGTIVFRVLCPSSKSGSLIGKGGGVVSKIRQETGAKVRIEDSVAGCEERVVVITGTNKETEVGTELSKEDDKHNGNADEDEDSGDHEETEEEKETSVMESRHSEKATSSAQKALLLVFERIVESDSEADDVDEEDKKSAVLVRLLVLSSQVGCLMGKGGSVIKQMSAESGAQIRILPRDKLPLCATTLDELVQISGELDAVRKALLSVSQQLLDNPPRERDTFSSNKPSGPSSFPFASHPRPEIARPDVLPLPNYHFPVQGPPFPIGPHESVDYRSSIGIPRFRESIVPGGVHISPEPMMYRLICANDKVGSVIGKGGSIVKMLQHETGCDIKIIEAVPDSDDRVIVIMGPALPDDRISPVQDAVLRVQSRIVMAVPENKENVVLARVLVSSNQTGCLLGRGGSIIAEMRKMSGAHIRILGKEQRPKCAAEDEEVVQVTGEFESVQEALLQITTRLKHHLFRDKFPASNHPMHPPLVDQVPPFASYGGRREPSPPGMFSNMGPQFPKFDSFGSHRRHDERSAFPFTTHSSGVPPIGGDRVSSSAPWAAQHGSDGGGPIPTHDYPGTPQRRMGGFAGRNQPAVITNTTVDVVVPRALVSTIYGEDGGCLKQIREISGAKITITEPRPGATETVIIISGTPEQTHAAQSLLQAFVMSGSSSP